MDGQVRDFGPLHLARQGFGVLTTATLLEAVRVAEVDLDVHGSRRFAVARHLFILVVGLRVTHRFGYSVALGCEARQSRFGRCVGHVGQQHQKGRALDQHAYAGAVAGALNQSALAVPRHEAVIDLGRSHMGVEDLRDLPSAMFPVRTRPACVVSLTQAGSPRLCATHPRVARRSCCRLSRARRAVRGCRDTSCVVSGQSEPATTARSADARRCSTGRRRHATCAWVLLGFGAHAWRFGPPGIRSRHTCCCGRAPDSGNWDCVPASWNRSKALPLLMQARQRHAFHKLQLSISGRHLQTLPIGSDVALQT